MPEKDTTGSGKSKMAREWMQAMMEAEDRAAKDDAITVQMLGEAHREIRESAAISPQR
jgi:hypothetical protein